MTEHKLALRVQQGADAEEILLPVQAHAGARKNQITGVHDGRLKVSVTQAPEKGKANQAIQNLIAEAFGLAKCQVTLVSGTTSSRKVFSLNGISLTEIQTRQHEIVGGNDSTMNHQ